MVQAIVFLPLLGAILAGLIAIFGAHARNPSGDEVEHHDHGHGDHAHAAAPMTTMAMTITAMMTTTSPSRRRRVARGRADHHGPAVRFGGAVLGDAGRCRLPAPRLQDRAVPLDQFRRSAGGVGAARRYADRRDAGGGQHRLLARAPLFHRLHGRGSEPAALLRLSVAVHLRDADAGDRGQSGPAVLRLGRRRSRQLPADRLLVPEAVGECGGDQGLRGQPRRRFRLCARHLRHLHAAQDRPISRRSSPAPPG